MRVALPTYVACAFVAAPVWAAQSKHIRSLELTFQTELAHHPDHLCIVTDTRDDNSIALRDLTAVAEHDPTTDGVWRFPPKRDSPGNPPNDSRAATSIALLSHQDAIAAALEAMAERPVDAASACAHEFDVCTAEFRAPLALEVVEPSAKKPTRRTLYIRCQKTEQGRGMSDGKRTVVVQLSKLVGASPGIQSLRFEGTVATVNLDMAVDDHSAVVASVLGGNYASTATVGSSGNRIDLPLRPRCTKRRVEVPFDGPVSAVLKVKVRDDDSKQKESRCPVTAVNGSLNLMLPVNSSVASTNLSVTAAGPNGTQTVVETSWIEPDPPATVTMRIRELWWQWRRHCLYPREKECPRASIGDNRFRCTNSGSDGELCTYTCLTPNAVSTLPLPARVRFDGPDGTQWSDFLSDPGQTLTDFVQAGDRSLVLDFERWRVRPVADKEIDLMEGIELFLPGIGEPLRVPVRSSLGLEQLRVRTPGLQCNDKVEYALHSRRPSIHRTEKIDSGAVTVDRPEALTLPVLFGVSAFVGYSRPVRYPNFFGSGGEELGFPDNVLFGIDVTTRWLPRRSNFFVDLGLGYVLGNYEYHSLGTNSSLDAVWYQRYNVSVLAGYQIAGWFGFGVVTRLWYGNALRSENGDFAPANQFGVRHGLRLEAWPSHSGAFLYEYNLGWNESVHTVARDRAQRFVSSERRAHGWMMLGYRFNLRGLR